MSSSLSASGLAISSSLQPTVPAYPTTLDIATVILAYMGAQSGVLTDYNQGSIIRTLAESLGSPIELQSISEQTLAYQSMIYGAISAFGIVPLGATSATGTVTFTSPGPATQAVSVPAGTLLQTNGGIQFQTISTVAIASGDSMASIGAIAVSGGTTGNVAASGVNQILTGLSYPLTVLNQSAMAGGANAESLAGTLARFAAAVAAPGLASPVAVADGAIGLQFGSETVVFSNCYEAWLGVSGSTAIGFTLYIDDGTGSASSGLIGVVQTAISANPGFRPAGVPFSIASTAPVYATISVSGAVLNQYSSSSGTIATAISGAITAYGASLPIAQTLYLGNLSAIVGNAGEGQLANFNVVLGVSGGASSVTSLSASYSGRVVISNLTVSIAA